MFNLMNCRLQCSCSRGRCLKGLGAKAQIARGDQAPGPGGLRFAPRKRHKRMSHFFPPALFLLLFSPLLSAADLSTYRGFQFGMSRNAAVKHSGMNASEVTLIHKRPARIEELSWRPRRFSLNDTDPVEEVALSFYDGQLFRMVINYSTEKTKGLSSEDIIEAVSVQYGSATRPATNTLLPSDSFSEGMTVMARWENADYLFTLVQAPYGSTFELIAFSKRLDGLAQTAIVAGIRLDEQEGPQRLKTQERDARMEQQKIRLVQQGHFRP